MIKIVYCLLLVVLALGSENKVNAKAKPKPDTVYYLIDTAKIPINDRLIRFGVESGHRFITLDCSCYGNSKDAFVWFIYNKQERRITHAQLDRLKLLKLSELLNIIHQYGIDKVKRHEFVFIEPDKDEYSMHVARIVPPLNWRVN